MTETHTHYKNQLILWLSSRFVANFAKQMLGLIVAWRVFELTHDPLALGIIGLMEGVPYVAFALWSGHLADRHERRSLMLISVCGLFACAIGFFSLTYITRSPLLGYYLVSGLIGISSAFEIASSAYLQTLVPQEEYPRVIAWNLSLFQTAMITGPLFAGALVTHAGARVAFGTAATILAVALVLTACLKKIYPQGVDDDASALARVLSGLKFIRSQKMMVSAMSLDMFAVLFGDVVALFPIFADRFGAGAVGLGILQAAPSVGSVFMSVLHSVRPVFEIRWRTFLRAVVVFGLCIIAFALSPYFWLAAAFLVIGGCADSLSVIFRASLYRSLTPDHMRGRVSSVNGIFIRTSNEIGAFESGFVARIFGVVPSVIAGASLTLACAAFMKLRFPELDESKLST
jgi:MFS family permease